MDLDRIGRGPVRGRKDDLSVRGNTVSRGRRKKAGRHIRQAQKAGKRGIVRVNVYAVDPVQDADPRPVDVQRDDTGDAPLDTPDRSIAPILEEQF